MKLYNIWNNSFFNACLKRNEVLSKNTFLRPTSSYFNLQKRGKYIFYTLMVLALNPLFHYEAIAAMLENKILYTTLPAIQRNVILEPLDISAPVYSVEGMRSDLSPLTSFTTLPSDRGHFATLLQENPAQHRERIILPSKAIPHSPPSSFTGSSPTAHCTPMITCATSDTASDTSLATSTSTSTIAATVTIRSIRTSSTFHSSAATTTMSSIAMKNPLSYTRAYISPSSSRTTASCAEVGTSTISRNLTSISIIEREKPIETQILKYYKLAISGSLSALHNIKKEAESGHYFAQGCLALLNNHTEARLSLWVLASKESKNPYAEWLLGHFYLKGFIPSIFGVEAAQAFHRAAHLELLEAEYDLGNLCMDRTYKGFNEEYAFDCYKRASDKGHVGAYVKMQLLNKSRNASLKLHQVIREFFV